MKIRARLYMISRIIGTIEIILCIITGNFKSACKRIFNKFIGKKIISKLYLK